jgi:hypothetical protein
MTQRLGVGPVYRDLKRDPAALRVSFEGDFAKVDVAQQSELVPDLQRAVRDRCEALVAEHTACLLPPVLGSLECLDQFTVSHGLAAQWQPGGDIGRDRTPDVLALFQFLVGLFDEVTDGFRERANMFFEVIRHCRRGGQRAAFRPGEPLPARCRQAG